MGIVLKHEAQITGPCSTARVPPAFVGSVWNQMNKTVSVAWSEYNNKSIHLLPLPAAAGGCRRKNKYSAWWVVPPIWLACCWNSGRILMFVWLVLAWPHPICRAASSARLGSETANENVQRPRQHRLVYEKIERVRDWKQGGCVWLWLKFNSRFKQLSVNVSYRPMNTESVRPLRSNLKINFAKAKKYWPNDWRSYQTPWIEFLGWDQWSGGFAFKLYTTYRSKAFSHSPEMKSHSRTENQGQFFPLANLEGEVLLLIPR